MKISTILNSGKPILSFEVFPPKNADNLAAIFEASRSIAKLGPDFMSITYGAGGSNAGYAQQLAAYLQNDCHITALAHLTCVSSSSDTIHAELEAFRAAGIRNLLALRGDVPDGSSYPQNASYLYAYQLVEEIRRFDADFCIGAACYPEGHVECPSKDQDLLHLKHKVEAGCDFLTTQMFFDNAVLYGFLYRMLAQHIDVPVIAGIMPVTNVRQIRRSCELSGATLPPRFKSILDKFGGDEAAMRQAGIAYATEQIIDLIANGVRGVHVYVMNKPEVAAAIAANVSEIIK
ncbi:MAG: methylenetetrahydrofolate reductase [Bacillota bacterium]|nr:methylenetetrahydrofolate reductase [Bacillota bacterium]